VVRTDGVKFGRHRFNIDLGFNQTYDEWKADQITVTEVMMRSGLKKATF
jgi:hypothetical protein